MQERSVETRASILESSVSLFASQGYDATGVAEICAAAGVSKGAFYHHFPSKQAVFLAILEEWLSALDLQLEQKLADSKDIPSGLIEMASITQGIFTAADGHLAMFIEFWSQSLHDPEVWRATVDPYRRYTRLFSGYIQRGIDEGSLRLVDPDAAARMIVGLAVGTLAQGLMDPDSTDWGDTAISSMEMIINGLKREKS
jgi:AcrR family transcriptional regulator